MVAIFTGLGAGLERGSGSTLGSMGVLGGASMGRGGDQVSLNAASGNLVITKSDEFLVGRGPDATIARTYNSQGAFDDDNGDGWRQSTNRRMTLQGTANASGSRVSRISGDGSEIVYNWNGSYYATTEGGGAHDKITHAGGVLTWTDGDSQMVENYELVPGSANQTYRIVRQTDTDGNSLTFSYAADGKLSRVTTADGSADRNFIEYRWTGNNITQIDTTWIEYRDSIIRTLTRTRYGYDSLNRLATVRVDLSPENRDISDGKAYVTTYTYDGTSTRIQSITQTDGSKVEFGYEAFGSTHRVTSIRQWVDAATSRTTTIGYDVPNRATTITDPSGAQTRLTYDAGGQLLQIQQPALTAGAGQPVTKFEYNTAGDVIRISSYRDLAQLAANNAASETRYSHDDNGNVKEVTDALGNVVTRVYGDRNQLLSETSTIAAGVTATTRYVYDYENHLRYAISPEGRVTEYRYRGDGALEQTIEFPHDTYIYTPPGPVPPASGSNASFETPEVGSRVVYNPGVSGMTFASTSGIAGNGSYLFFPSAPDGDQVAFIHDRGGSPASIMQSLAGLTAGTTYTVRFLLARGWEQPAPITVSFNGQALGTFTPTSSSVFQEFVVSFVPTTSSGTLAFSGPPPGVDQQIGDRYTAIDNVRIAGPIAGGALGPNEGDLTAWRDSIIDYSTARVTIHNHDGRGNLGVSSSYSMFSMGFSETYSRTNYIYDQTGRMLSRMVDGQIAETFTYDGLGRMVSSTDLNGARTDIVFDDAASRTVVSMANGYVKTSTYNRLGELINVIDSGHTGAATSTLMTVATTSFESPEAGNGHIQNAFSEGMSFYGSSGIAGNGSTWNFAPAPDGDQVAYVQATPGLASVFEYRLSGLAVGARYTVKFYIGASASRGGASVSLSLNGQFIGAFTPNSTSFQEVTATFTATQSTGQLWFSGEGAAGSATAIDKVAVQLLSGGDFYQYDSRGLLRVAIDGTGSKSYCIHDRIGRKVADVNALGELVEYVYDALGRVVGTARYAKALTAAQLDSLADTQTAIDLASFRPAADTADLWTWQVYDREGRLVQAIGGDGSVVSHEYDLSNRLIKTVAYANPLSTTTVNGFKAAPPTVPAAPSTDAAKDSVARSFYDKDGMLIGVLDGEGFLSKFAFDKAGLKVEEIYFLQPSAAAYRATGTFEQLLANQTVSAGDRRARYVYDGQRHLRYQINGLNELIKLNYNVAGQITSTERYPQSIPETANFSYSNIKKVVADLGLSNHADTRRDWIVYDGGGRTAYSIDAAGRVVRLFYNVVGQVSRTVQYETARATSALPSLADMDAWAAGQASNAKTRTTRHYYNQAGDELFSVDPEGFVSGQEYDAERRITRVVRWKNKIAATDADTTQTVANLVRNLPFSDSRNIYDPAGRLSETVDGEGVKRRLDYNANGTVKWETAAYGTADASRTAFVYDNAGRVREQIAAHGTDDQAAIKSEYDGLGNLIKHTDGRGNVSTFAYDRLGRLTKQTDAENNVVAFEYNAFGERAKATDARGNSTIYAYDKLGRIISVTDAEGYLIETTYTEFGEVESIVRRATRSATAGQATAAATSSSGQVRVAYGPNILTNPSFDKSGTYTTTPVGRSNTTLPGWSKSNTQAFEQVSAGQFGIVGTDGAYWLDLESVVKTGRSPVGTNLVTNGSFELSGSFTATSTGRANSTLPGWTKTNPEAFEQVQSGQLGVAASDGTYWLDLDSVARTGVETYGSNLVANGSFELSGSFVATPTGRSNTNLPGWSKSNPETFEQVQSAEFGVRASDGLYWLDLDSVPQTTGRTIVGANLLVNGSFGQTGSYVTTPTGRSSATMVGWTKANPETFEQVASGQMGVTTHDGGFWLDLESIPTTGPVAVGSNLLLNGGFESSGAYVVVPSGRANMTLPGWSKTNPEDFEQVESDATDVGPIEGNYMLDLDSVPTAIGMVDGPNLIVNGSFEQSASSYSATGVGRYNELNIPGWTRLNAQGFEQLNSGYDGVAATDGTFYLDMEANGGAESRMDISQTVQGLAAGQQLSLKFDYANTAGMVASVEELENSGALEVYWNGALVGRVSSHDAAMVTKGFTVTSVEGDNILRFVEIGVTDGRGVYLDNVRLTAKVTPPNLIVNGSFEQSAETWASTINGRINIGNLPGWVKTNSGEFEQMNSGAFGVASTDGSFYLDMEGGGSDGRMDISQTIAGLKAGKKLTLTFDFANNTAQNSGALEVYWNNALIATISSTESAMTAKSYAVTSKGGDNTLRFREIGVADGRGVSIDNVQLYETPPTASGGNMDIYQTVSNLTAGQVMQLQFDYARLASVESASFEVWWNDALVASIADGKKEMKSASYFVTAIAGNNKLRFKGTGTVDGAGAALDNVRLFATQAPPHGGNMDISQTVANLAAGQIMELQFDHANRTTSASGSFEVWWNNALVSTITSTGTTMQTKSYSLVAVAGNNTVRFKSLGTVDAAGASLDNVRLYNTEPVTTGGNMKISQVISNLEAGQMLQLQFDHANRTTSTSGSFEVLWNGAVVATINSTGTTMQTKGYVVTAVAGNNTLEFRGLGEAEGAGASIDNVRLFKARPAPTGGNMAIAQVVPNLTAGQVLQLQFDHANRTSSVSGGFQVLWNGAVVAEIDSTDTAMRTKTLLVTAITGDNRLEFKALGTVDADGASIDNVRLFATQADLSGGNMVISQDVANLTEGQVLELKFNHANRTTSASGSFQVVWNGNVVATITSSDPVMQTKAYFVTAVAGTNRLEFRGLGTVDGEGASLDNVSLRATELKSPPLAVGSGDSADSVTRFYYDRLGRATVTRDAEDYLTETVYNQFGEATSITRRATRTGSSVDSVPTVVASDKDAVTQFEYDQLGRLKKVIDAENHSETYELDAFGRRTALVNKLGGRTTYEYDNRGLLTSVTLPISSKKSDGQAVPVINKFEYDKRGNNIKSIEAFGLPEERTTTFHYDKLNRLTRTEGMSVTVLDQNGHMAETRVTPTQTIQYDGAGNVIAAVDSLGARTLFYYDGANRKKAELNAAGLLTTFGYDRNGNLINRKSYAARVTQSPTPGGPAPDAPAGEFRETIFEYDKLNRLTKTRIPGVTTGRWDGTNYALSAAEIVSTLEYDADGNVIKSTDANGGVVYTFYDRLGRSTAQVDQENYLTSWERDSQGNVLTERRAAQRAAWTATTKSPPVVAVHGDDRVTTFSYDRNGRRRFENRANVVSYSVNANGLAVANTATTATIEYRYNGLGLVTHKVEATGDTLVYDYDHEGRLVTETHQGYADQDDIQVKPKVTYSYDGLNLLTQTRQGGETASPGDRITTNEYVAGRLSATTDATGAKYFYAYDAAGNLLRESYMRQRAGAASVEEAVLYERDILGRTTARTIAAKSGQTWSKGDSQDVAYNLFGEVSQRGTNGKGQEQYRYDKAGRLSSTNSGDGVWRFFLQDGNGNQTLAVESEGMDLAGRSLDEVLTIAKGGSQYVGGAYASDILVTFTVYDQRGSATETRMPHRELNATDPRVELVLFRDFNAFGEALSERDANGALTTYTYNTMGRTISIARPIVASTNESGFEVDARPVETLYFDLSGRLVGSQDPNGHAITRHLLAGTGYGGTEALTVTEFHADAGRVQNRYDVFGDLRETVNEVGRTAEMTYDGRGRLIRFDKAGGLVEHFVYDLMGQRIEHWNSVLGAADVESTEYDMQGRIRSQRAFGGDVTTTSYAWASDMVTDGMGAFGGWIETTTYANSRQKIEHSDVFGRIVKKTDLGGHVFNMKYDKAARLVEDSGGETMTYSYLNSGMVGSIATSRRNSSGAMETWDATFGYDKNGNKVREQLSQNDILLQDASAEYDALNRLTLWREAGTATTPYSRVAYKYDANSNIRMIHADYSGLDGWGNATEITSKVHWYRFDAMNRVVVSKGVLGNDGIVGGSGGVEIRYDAAGQRVRTLRSEQRIGRVFAPHPSNHWVEMPYTHEIVETYSYDDAGHLNQVFMAETNVVWENGFIPKPPVEPGQLKADYDYDALGRLQSQKDYRDGWDVVYERTITDYNARGQIFKEFTVSKQQVPNQQTGAREWTTFRTETKNYYGGETQTPEERLNEREIGPDALGGVVKVVNKNLRNGALTHWSVTDTAYDWWDGAVQSVVALRADLWDPTKDSHTLFSYNAWGQLEKANVNDGRRREVRFTNNLAGEAIRRDEQDSNGAGDPHEVWHRFNGRQMGYVGNNGTLNIDYQSSINARTHYVGPSQGAFRLGDGNATPHADFDQNYSAINSFEQGSSGGTYTVRAGDTLGSIAAQLWGDSSLWYKLAEANGLGAESGLTDGQRLTIPVGVFKTHHNASTFMPFDAASVAGDLSPTAPRPQAPVQKKNKCGIFGTILLIVVAAAVTFLTQGALAGPMTGLFNSALAGNIVAGGIAGAAGSLASQTVGVLTGIQERFDWKGVAMAGISGAVGGALGGWNAFGKTGLGKFTDLANDITRAAAASAITQGIGVATGLQGKFSWAGVAAAGVSAGVSGFVGRKLGIESFEDLKDKKGNVVKPGDTSLGNHGKLFMAGSAGAIAGAATQSLLDGSDFGDNVLGGLVGVAVSTIGNMFKYGVADPKKSQNNTQQSSNIGGSKSFALTASLQQQSPLGDFIKTDQGVIVPTCEKGTPGCTALADFWNTGGAPGRAWREASLAFCAAGEVPTYARVFNHLAPKWDEPPVFTFTQPSGFVPYCQPSFDDAVETVDTNIFTFNPGLGVGPALGNMRPPPQMGVAFFGENNLHHWQKPNPTLNAPGKYFFMMRPESANLVTNSATAMRYTGQSASTEFAYKSGGRLFRVEVPLEGIFTYRPTSAHAQGWPHFREGGFTAVRTSLGPEGGYLINRQVPEFIARGGQPAPPGTTLYEIINGQKVPLQTYGTGQLRAARYISGFGRGVGYVGMVYGGVQDGRRLWGAGQQSYATGDYSIVGWETARVGAGWGGAIAGAKIGGGLGATGGYYVAGPPGAAVGGIVGGGVGAYGGYTYGETFVNSMRYDVPKGEPLFIGILVNPNFGRNRVNPNEMY